MATDNTMVRLVTRLFQYNFNMESPWEEQGEDTNLIHLLREIKNSTIGNQSRKLKFLAAGIIQRLAIIIMGAKSDQLLLESMAVMGSLFNVTSKTSEFLLITIPSNGQVRMPLSALAKHITHDNVKVVETAIRSLKVMYECVPSLRSHNDLSILEERNIAAKLVKFLEPPSSNHSTVSSITLNVLSAKLIANACVNRTHQDMVASCGGIQSLSQMLFSTHVQTHEAALEALSSLCYHNEEISLQLVTNEGILSQILALLKSKKAKTRLLAVNCMANINTSTSSEVLSEHLKQNEIKGTVLPTILKLLNMYAYQPTVSLQPSISTSSSAAISPEIAPNSGSVSTSTSQTYVTRSPLENDDNMVREAAPRVLAKLIANSHELQLAACESDTVSRLSTLLHSEGISDMGKEHILLALAALCSRTEEARKLLVDLKALDPIVQALKSSHNGLKEAAFHCSRGLSRAEKQTRVFMLQAGFPEPLVRCLADSQRGFLRASNIATQIAACVAVGNLSLEFSPVKSLVVEYDGCMDAIMAMTRSLNLELRINSLALLKNLVNKARDVIKNAVFQKMTGDYLLHLLRDPDEKVRELAFSILRNLSCTSSQGMERFFQQHGRELVQETTAALSNAQSHTQTLLQAVYFLSNASVASNKMRELTMEKSTIDHIIALIQHQDPDVRVAVLFTISNLTWKDGDLQIESRVRYFRDAGVESKVRRLLEREALVDVRMRSKQVLEQIKDRSQDGGNRVTISAPATHDPVAT